MASEPSNSVSQIADLTHVSVSTVYRWIKQGKIIAIKGGPKYAIPYNENRDFINAKIRKNRDKPPTTWAPKSLNTYSKWHELLDEICWLIKVCYSSKNDIKHKIFRLDRLFVNYLAYHKVTLKKVQKVFESNPKPSYKRVTDDLKRGWYNELSYSFPLRKSTLGLSFSDIEINKPKSSERFAFPSWRITSSYYSIYFYLRAITLLKVGNFRIQEHNATILSFKNNVFQPLGRGILMFPFNIIYIPKNGIDKQSLLFEKLEHTRYMYCNHPRYPNRSIRQIFDRVYKTYLYKAKKRTKKSSYMLFDYLHDFRIWANYLDIDNLLNLWGPGYKTFIDQNLSMLMFFIGGISEICYLSVFGEKRYVRQIQHFYDSFITNSPELEKEFINTPIFQRHNIYKQMKLIEKTMVFKHRDDINTVISSPNI